MSKGRGRELERLVIRRGWCQDHMGSASVPRKGENAMGTTEVLRWASACDDEVVQLFWAKLCEAVDEPMTASGDRVLRELRAYGGNTVANWFRDDPVPYSEVAGDVAAVLDGWFGSGEYRHSHVESCERFTLRVMEVDAAAVGSLCSAVRAQAVSHAARREGSKAALKVAAYGVGRTLARQAARAVAARAAREAGKRVAVKLAQRVAARILASLNVAFAAWTVIDLAGPATRVTIPGVTYVAILRKLHEAAHEPVEAGEAEVV